MKIQSFGINTLIFLLIILFCSQTGFAQSSQTKNILKLDNPNNMPNAKIEDVSWIAGCWQGKMFGGIGEEVWSEPSHGTMMGMYKLSAADSVKFYELMIILEKSNSLILKLKHFNADLTAWEEKKEMVDFPLVKLTPTAAFFDGLTFRKKDKNTIQCYLLMDHKDGKPNEIEWIYRRVKN